MTIRLSTNLRSRLLGPEAFTDILPLCEIRVFTGAQPAAADLAQAGTLLGRVSLRGITGAALVLQRQGPLVTKPLTASWLLHATTAGIAGWFRLCLPADAGASDALAPRLDGAITAAGATTPGEMQWSNTAVLAGQFYPIDYFLFGLPPIGATS